MPVSSDAPAASTISPVVTPTNIGSRIAVDGNDGCLMAPVSSNVPRWSPNPSRTRGPSDQLHGDCQYETICGDDHAHGRSEARISAARAHSGIIASAYRTNASARKTMKARDASGTLTSFANCQKIRTQMQ